MTLSTPLIYAISAFDPSYTHTFEFSYIGNQVVSNRAIIINIDTQTEVYNVVQDGLKLNHVLPANVLETGNCYTIQIQVYDNEGNYSNLSDAVLFYCYTTPQFYFSNVNDGDTISSANFELNLKYIQEEDEQLNEYKYYVYDITKTLIYTSDSYYSKNDLTHAIYGLKNQTMYYVQAVGKTTHGMNIDTGIIGFSVKYNTVASNIGFEAINDKKTGCVLLNVNIISIEYEIKTDNYTLKDGMVGLVDNVLTYNVDVEGDFSLIIKAKNLPIGTFCWTTDGNVSVAIENICDRYYCHLSVCNENVKYNVFKGIDNAQLVDANGNVVVDNRGNYIVIAETEGYDDNALMCFTITRKNNIYDVDISYA